MVDYSALLTTAQPLTANLPPLAVSDPLSSRLDNAILTSSSAATAALQAPPKNDIDVFWRNIKTGDTRRSDGKQGSSIEPIAAPNSPSTVPSTALPTLGLDWKLVSSNDYNRDGQTDLLWRNLTTGDISWSLLNGTATPKTVALPNNKDFAWEIVSTADYNRDGTIDLLWRNAVTGQNAWWEMTGTDANPTYRSVFLTDNKNVPLNVPDLNWKIVSTNDYNNDGQVDILWRNIQTGENAWWLMNGATLVNSVMLLTVPVNPVPVNDLAWQVVGTGDYNTDGQVDLLWRDKNGRTVWWMMNGKDIASTSWLPTETNLNWQAIGVSDRYVTAIPLSGNALPPTTIANTAPTLIEDQITLAPNFFLPPTSVSKPRTLNANSFDLYQINLGQSGIFTASLTNLVGDADIRLIQDTNGNSNINPGEVKAWQWERGNKDEKISSFLNAGTYFVQVYGYNGQLVNYQLKTDLTPAVSDPQKFKINLQFDPTSLSGLNSLAQQAVRAAADFWESVIPTRSAITKFSDLTINISGRSLDFNTFAMAGPVFESDRKTVTITRGEAYINTQRLTFFSGQSDYLRLIMIHEFAHVLGFGTLWEPIKFDTGNGPSLAFGKNLINRDTATYNIRDSLDNVTYASWAYGDLLKTSTVKPEPTAVPIEPGILAHWDERRFGVESLTPFAESVGTPTPVSALTVSALRDLGWNVNYGAADAYSLAAVTRAITGPISRTTTAALPAITAKCGCSGCLASLKTLLLGNAQLTDLV